MVSLEFQSIIAVVSIAIPLVAFVWEFAIVRRKRLGYRVQMDTRATSPAHPGDAQVFANMGSERDNLVDPTFVLVRIENAGLTHIDTSDYVMPGDVSSGLQVRFPGRRIVDMAVSEVSPDELITYFYRSPGSTPTAGSDSTELGSGFTIGDDNGTGIVWLPRVKLDPGDYYKVLAVLDSRPGYLYPTDPKRKYSDPEFLARVAGQNTRWFRKLSDRLVKARLARTESHTFASRPALIGIGLLAVAVLAQSGITLFWTADPPPLDCVGGTLQLHGSTAFEPATRAAAARYVELCAGKGARIPIEDGTFDGSTQGVSQLEAAGRKARADEKVTALGDHITFTDGYAEGSHPEVLPRPIAYSVFTLVVHQNVKVERDVLDLSRQQIRDIYTRRITNWSGVGGPDLPIKLVNRHRGSGTRTAFVDRVLNDEPAAGATPAKPRIDVPEAQVGDCAALPADEPGVCEVDSTQELLQKVAATAGALGMSEVSNAATAVGVAPVHIDHLPATLAGAEDGRYPYWQTEFAYTYGELPADSIAAAFLRYLTDQGGKDILREHGSRPCSETEYPLECRPQ